MTTNPMTDPCVEAVARAIEQRLKLQVASLYYAGTNGMADEACERIAPNLAEAAIAAMHSSRPVEDGRVLAETAYAQEGPAREGETHGHHVLRIAEKAASLALTRQALGVQPHD